MTMHGEKVPWYPSESSSVSQCSYICSPQEQTTISIALPYSIQADRSSSSGAAQPLRPVVHCTRKTLQILPPLTHRTCSIHFLLSVENHKGAMKFDFYEYFLNTGVIATAVCLCVEGCFQYNKDEDFCHLKENLIHATSRIKICTCRKI